MLALGSPGELDVLGITAVAGNVPVALTSRNIRVICELCNRRDVKVYAGADRPLVRQLVTAEHVHGKDRPGRPGGRGADHADANTARGRFHHRDPAF